HYVGRRTRRSRGRARALATRGGALGQSPPDRFRPAFAGCVLSFRGRAMTRHRVALLALVVFTLVGCLWSAACTVCEEPDETKDVLPTGDYVVSGVDLDRAGEWQWMK